MEPIDLEGGFPLLFRTPDGVVAVTTLPSGEVAVLQLPGGRRLGVIGVADPDRAALVAPSGRSLTMVGGPEVSRRLFTRSRRAPRSDGSRGRGFQGWGMDPEANVGWVGTSSGVTFFDLDTAEVVTDFVSPCGGVIDTSPDLSIVLTGCTGRDVEVIDRATGDVLATLADSASLQNNGVLLPEKGVVALMGFGGLQLFDLDSGDPLTDLLPGEASISFSGELITIRNDDRIAVLDPDPGAWVAAACVAAGRSVTAAEWEVFMPDGVPYEPTCNPADA